MRRGNSRTMGEATSGFAGADSREWCSYALVDDKDAVTYDPEMGPLVSVTLQPSKVPARCTVASMSAGAGEAEYIPFVAGDMVVVVLPEGNTWAGPVIVGKVNNKNNPYPAGSVAGQDPTKNNFAFKRNRTAYVHEVDGGWLVRDATSTGFIQIANTTGNVTLKNGNGDALQITKDMAGFQSADGKKLFQVDIQNGRFRAQVDDALLLLSSTSSSSPNSTLVAPALLAVSAGAQPAAEHVATTESVVNLLMTLLGQFASANPGPVTGALLTTWLSTAAAAAIVLTGTTPLLPPIATAIQGAFAAMGQKPPGVPALGQLLPGVGCPSFNAG